MKKSGFIFVCLLFAVLLNGLFVSAGAINSITAVFGGIKLVVDGKTVMQETLFYNNTTYVPLRAAAEILGKEVSYDPATQTAYIDENGTNRQIQTNGMNNGISVELKALMLVRDYSTGINGSVFEPLDGLTYKYKDSNYKIEYDSQIDDDLHLIHEYEFVMDNFISGEGHTATVNWYEVNTNTGEVIPMF
jgi:hypothetical protein